MLHRRSLEEVVKTGMPPAIAAATATTATIPTAFTNKDRMEVIRAAASMSEILRATLRRGKYFKGAMGVHDCVEVHRAALRAAATMMRKVRIARETEEQLDRVKSGLALGLELGLVKAKAKVRVRFRVHDCVEVPCAPLRATPTVMRKARIAHRDRESGRIGVRLGLGPGLGFGVGAGLGLWWRGSYVTGAVGTHDHVGFYRAVLRAAATLTRKARSARRGRRRELRQVWG